MAPDSGQKPRLSEVSLVRNWLSLCGVVLSLGGLFSFLLLVVLDSVSRHANPYVGILTYLVAPVFIVGGVVLFGFGVWLRRRRLGKERGWLPPLKIDLSMPENRKAFGMFLFLASLFLLLSAIGSYQTYHFTESVQFCGQACHTVMKPELVTYLQGPHARVSCAECHIGKGAGWWVKSKLSGTYQVYATLLDKYPRPIPTPIRNLRPAQETCEQCHWPQKFTGNLERTSHYYLTDETNTHFAVRMLLKVGGADPTHGPVGGIHYHMNVANKIEYLATDESRQKIPWVRVTDARGVVTEYRLPRFAEAVDESKVRRMDCMDCHNRPAHRYKTPNGAVNLALALGAIDPGIPGIKSNAVFALTQRYTNEAQAVQEIENYLVKKYGAKDRTLAFVGEVKRIYQNNFFPEMKADWLMYPDNIGHKEWAGCFRCHDGAHVSLNGKRKVTKDCDSCHTILGQGTGEELLRLTPQSQKFRHPADEVDGGCNDCHTGGI